MTLSASTLDAVLAATWPAADTQVSGPFTLRRSPGGGSRVSAATLDTRDVPTPVQIDDAIARMRSWGQIPRFRLRAGQARFDALLAARGYDRHDPTMIFVAPLDSLPSSPPRLTAFAIWPPLAIQTDIWSAAGIGPDRLAVMARVTGPRTAIFGRQDDRPAGTGFVAAHAGVAMLHALEVRPQSRRRGLARHMIAQAVTWARHAGCSHLAVAVTRDNAAACALYAGMGMTEGAAYHYRAGPTDHA